MRRISTVNCIFLILVVFNLLFSFGAIWSLQRIEPQIERIKQRNAISLGACEEMLQALARGKVEMDRFREALARAEGYVTEKGEREALDRLRALLPGLAAGRQEAMNEAVDKIVEISRSNKAAIIKAIRDAQHFGQEGARYIVFLTLLFFLLVLYFGRKFRRELLIPLEELSSAVEAFLAGDTLRRCSLPFAEEEMKKIFRAVNELMDRLCRFR